MGVNWQKFRAVIVFFLNVSTFCLLQHTHYPHYAGPGAAGKSLRGPFGDALFEFDKTIGSLLATLERTGVLNNTLIFFTSDNGLVFFWLCDFCVFIVCVALRILMVEQGENFSICVSGLSWCAGPEEATLVRWDAVKELRTRGAWESRPLPTGRVSYSQVRTLQKTGKLPFLIRPGSIASKKLSNS